MTSNKIGTFFACVCCVVVCLPATAANSPYDEGLAAYKRGDYANAAQIFDLVLKSTPTNLNALYCDAVSWQQLKHWAQAKERYVRILQLYPDSSEARYARQFLNAVDPGLLATLSGLPPANATASSSHPSISVSDVSMQGLPERASFNFVKTSDGHMLVDLMFNGHPIKAYFDTGAGAFFYKDQLRAAGVDTNRAKDGGETHGWAGTAVRVAQMPAEIQLGTLKRTIDVRMEETTTSLGQNLIGQDLIAGYQYAIDDKANRVDLTRRVERRQKTDSLYDIPCTHKDGNDWIDITVNGKKVTAFIDTGSDATIVDPETAKALGIEGTGETSKGRGVGGDWTARVAYADIRVGPINKSGFRILIGGDGSCCLGQDLMQGWRCTFDRESKMLHFFH